MFGISLPTVSEGVATPLALLAPKLGASRLRPALVKKTFAASRSGALAVCKNPSKIVARARSALSGACDGVSAAAS